MLYNRGLLEVIEHTELTEYLNLWLETVALGSQSCRKCFLQEMLPKHNRQRRRFLASLGMTTTVIPSEVRNPFRHHSFRKALTTTAYRLVPPFRLRAYGREIVRSDPVLAGVRR
jgi:phytoene dehydrogenase-like protein